MQDTIKLKMSPSESTRIEALLKERGYRFCAHEHAFWRAQKTDSTVIFFHNGTVLLQGYSDQNAMLVNTFSSEKPTSVEVKTVLGLDESGKGDFFGPLVLAGVVHNENDFALSSLGVMDSKALTDSQIERVFESLKERVRYQVMVLEPHLYNSLYERFGNLNLLLQEKYIELIKRFALTDYDEVILDKFTQSERQVQTIRAAVAKKPFLITEKAERFPSVAAASIVARYFYCRWFSEKNRIGGYPLVKSSNAEAKALFQKLRKILPTEEFSKIAKTHFLSKDGEALFP